MSYGGDDYWVKKKKMEEEMRKKKKERELQTRKKKLEQQKAKDKREKNRKRRMELSAENSDYEFKANMYEDDGSEGGEKGEGSVPGLSRGFGSMKADVKKLVEDEEDGSGNLNRSMKKDINIPRLKRPV